MEHKMREVVLRLSRELVPKNVGFIAVDEQGVIALRAYNRSGPVTAPAFFSIDIATSVFELATVDELIEIIRSRMDAQQESEDEGE